MNDVDPMEAAIAVAWEFEGDAGFVLDEQIKAAVLAYLRALQERGPSEGMLEASGWSNPIIATGTWRPMLAALIKEIGQ